MMFHYPYYGYPYYRPYNRYQYNQKQEEKEHNQVKVNQIQEKTEKKVETKIKSEENRSEEEDRQYFEILDIRLYFDDILLICLIFFLYSEGIQDQTLFIALILLLLS